MIDRTDLEQSIREWENAPATYQTIEKLADLYAVYDHCYGRNTEEWFNSMQIESDFLQTASKKDIAKVMELMDELVESVRILSPNLYDGLMMRLLDI